MNVNVFIVNGDGVSRNADMNVCLMIRDVSVFGCECGSDAVSLAESVTPELVFFRLSAKDTGVCSEIEKLIKIYPAAMISVFAFSENGENGLESACRRAGASSFFKEDVSKDNFLYIVKNCADIIRSKRDKSGAGKNAAAGGGGFFSFITDVSGYNDVLSMNKRFGSFNAKSGSSGNLTYIRVFSFLYDFLVKCFLRDMKITVGAAADNRRITILFPYDESVGDIMEDSVFYSIAEKYIIPCGDFRKIYLDIDGGDFGCGMGILPAAAKKRLPDGFGSGVCFAKMFENIAPSCWDFGEIAAAAGIYKEFIEIFSFLADFLSSYAPSIEMEFHRDALMSALKDVDAALAGISAFRDGSGSDAGFFDLENDLYEAVLKFQILLHIYRRK